MFAYIGCMSITLHLNLVNAGTGCSKSVSVTGVRMGVIVCVDMTL